ncbi:MAG: GNAT family N-acetyltransferase, partial [Bacteroidia bacterium]|nr:GNAT family N-acetyltransferase [Bacteroidia bacterium]
MSLIIRKALPEDSVAIFNLINELALYEKAPEQVINTPENIRLHGFGQQPLFKCLVAVLNETVIGMSLCYVRYSTWKGPVLYLEDLVITES